MIRIKGFFSLFFLSYRTIGLAELLEYRKKGRLYSIKHIVKDTTDNERRNLLLSLHGLLIATWYRYMHHPIGRITCKSLCYKIPGALVGMWNSSMGSPWWINPSHQEWMLYHRATSCYLWNIVAWYPVIFSLEPLNNKRDYTVIYSGFKSRTSVYTSI